MVLSGAASALAVLVGTRWLRRVQVSGPSMLPTLQDGDRLLVRVCRRLRVGDVVVIHDPDEPARLVVKRVAAISDEGITVLGDNAAASRDSRTYGPVQRQLVFGRAWWRYYPLERSQRMARRAPDAA
jgi:nickel-type superoxide dismutase maturation protease